MAWYSASCVRSRSSAPASRTLCCSATHVLHDLAHGLGLDVLAIAVIHGDDRRVAAAAEALDRAERDLAVGSRFACADPELRLERLDDLVGPAERTGQVRADVDRRAPDRLEMEHVVEGRDRVAEGRRDLERVGGLLDRLARQPAVLLLR